jgi:hypothetical protein
MDWYTAHMLVDYAREILTRQIQGWTGVPLLLGEWSLAHGAHPVYNTSEVGIIYDTRLQLSEYTFWAHRVPA